MIRLVLSDVDGTLVRPDKSLSERTVAAVHALHDAGVDFAVTSGRPPRGMEMLVEPLALRTPLAGFNGGLLVEPGRGVLEERTLPDDVVPRAIELLESFGLAVWVYRGADWLVRDASGPWVEREARTVRFDPTVVGDFAGLTGVVKVMGVSDDPGAVGAAERALHVELGDRVSASRSRPEYLDVTHALANKGGVVRYLAGRYGVAADEIATIGDMPNDVHMFAGSGLSIAMGNADREVQRAASQVTGANDEDGFAQAVETFILGGRS